MHETTPKTAPTASAPGEGETDHEADLEITTLHPSSRTARFLLRAQRFGDSRLRHLVVSALLVGLALLLTVVTSLQQAFWPLVALVPSATATTATPVRLPTASQPSDWSALQARPLHFSMLAPGVPCPVSPVQSFHAGFGLGLGRGPVYPFGFTPDGQPAGYDPPRQTASGLVPGFTKLEWAIAPTYHGGVLVQGAQLDGQHPVVFNGGYPQNTTRGDWSGVHELELVSLPDGSGDWTDDGSYVRLEAPGCYAFQLDGSTFSYILIFRVGI